MINNSSSSFTSNTSFGAPPAFALKAKKTRTLTVSTIDHTYRDLSCLKIESLYDANRKSKNFPAKLHLICSNPEYAHIITWQPHGRSWALVNKELLCSVVLPKYFNHNKFE
eukprot:scaffold1850_cov164-Alexandrium_tamarense.AAC.1